MAKIKPACVAPTQIRRNVAPARLNQSNHDQPSVPFDRFSKYQDQSSVHQDEPSVHHDQPTVYFDRLSKHPDESSVDLDSQFPYLYDTFVQVSMY